MIYFVKAIRLNSYNRTVHNRARFIFKSCLNIILKICKFYAVFKQIEFEKKSLSPLFAVVKNKIMLCLEVKGKFVLKSKHFSLGCCQSQCCFCFIIFFRTILEILCLSFICRKKIWMNALVKLTRNCRCKCIKKILFLALSRSGTGSRP